MHHLRSTSASALHDQLPRASMLGCEQEQGVEDLHTTRTTDGPHDWRYKRMQEQRSTRSTSDITLLGKEETKISADPHRSTLAGRLNG